jgi:hypothetical protein
MVDRATESRIIRKALKDAGFNKCSVRHQRGTGWNWIRVEIFSEVKNRKDTYEDYKQVLEIAKKASGRDKYEDEKINVNFIYPSKRV